VTEKRIVRRSVTKRETVGARRPRQVVRRKSAGVSSPRGPKFQLSKRWIAAGVSAVFIATVFTLGLMVWRSGVFDVGHVRVQGNSEIQASAIIGRTDLMGANMFTLDLTAATSSLEKIPQIASAKLERQWPNTIRVVVKERQPWGTWEQAGVQYTIDRDGVVLKATPAQPGSPLVRSSEQTSLVIGQHVDYQAVEAAAELFDQLPKTVGINATEVAFIAGKGVQVTTAEGRTALFGDSSSIAYKLAVWAALAQDAKAKNINYTTVDLRYGNRPVLQ
jgi:cell division protein FtsQ